MLITSSSTNASSPPASVDGIAETLSTHRDVRLVAADGYGIGARLFEPKAPLGTVVIHGATAVPQKFYWRFAKYLSNWGLCVLTYDYRGVGASRPDTLRGFPATLSDWALLDARAALAFVSDLGGPFAVVGHSFGGQLIGLVDEVREASAAVFVGAQFGYHGHWTGVDRLKLAIIWSTVVPAAVATFGYLPGRLGLGVDLPAGVATEWARWCRHPDYLAGYYPDARRRFARFDRPSLFYSMTDDDLAPEPAVRSLLDALPSHTVHHRRVRPEELGVREVGHFGFFRGEFSRTLWSESRRFLGQALAGREPVRPEAPASLPSDPFGGVSLEEIMLDLEYGRA